MSADVRTDARRLLEGKQYDARHQTWEAAHELGSPIYSFRRSLILKLLPKEGESLYFLDVGCGTGDYARALLERGRIVDAIDISESAVQEAVKRVPERLRSRFHARVGDFSQLGQRARYNGIICSEVLEHVQDDEALLRQLHTLLLPRGSLILSVPADPALWSQDDDFSGHVRRYTREELVSKLTKAGLTVESLWSYGFPILRIYTWIKTKLLHGDTAKVVSSHSQGLGKVLLHFSALTVNALVWILDRHLLCQRRGIGFVAECRKA
jgi:2-polyprenyl-3-methyl-5-hydroxy-6-metoxy-1,4-benzoquinol methylase